MKKMLFSVFLLALLAGGQDAVAQRNNRKARTGERMERQAEALAKSMDLDGELKTTFVGLYKEYQDTLQAVRRDAMPSRKDKDEKLSEDEAEQRIQNAFERDRKVLELKQAYYQKFREHFTASQLVRVFAGGPQPFSGFQTGGRPSFGGPMPGGPGARGGFGGDW